MRQPGEEDYPYEATIRNLAQESTFEYGSRAGICDIAVRVGVDYGVVYLDTVEDDVYGFPVNLAARLSALAPPGAVVVSDAVEPLIRGAFEVGSRHTALVRGVEGTVDHYAMSGVSAGTATTTNTTKAAEYQYV